VLRFMGRGCPFRSKQPAEMLREETKLPTESGHITCPSITVAKTFPIFPFSASTLNRGCCVPLGR
jgi:hypothetical protein